MYYGHTWYTQKKPHTKANILSLSIVFDATYNPAKTVFIEAEEMMQHYEWLRMSLYQGAGRLNLSGMQPISYASGEYPFGEK